MSKKREFGVIFKLGDQPVTCAADFVEFKENGEVVFFSKFGDGPLKIDLAMAPGTWVRVWERFHESQTDP